MYQTFFIENRIRLYTVLQQCCIRYRVHQLGFILTAEIKNFNTMNEVTNNMETLREGSAAKDKRNETEVTLEDKTLVEVGTFAIL